ncbi:MAG: peptidase and chymotrypsin/Hap [Verrucomicrobiaceae bacterium]|nr:peptidase and chymotrypsin/Hap [Verrucomicrobiaceae bacterium]
MLPGCVQPFYEVRPLHAKQLERQVNNCRTLVLSVTPGDAQLMMTKHQLPASSTREIILGSAAPVSADGWFLTADHVVTGAKGHELIVIYNVAGTRRYGRARVVWQDAKADIALMKAAIPTPDYYRFTPRNRDLQPGSQILHAGMATGNKAQIGELSERVSGRASTGFLHTLRLAPGDSGGPVLLFSGELVGVNTAVGYVSALDTSFFNASSSSRPDPAVIQKLIEQNTFTHL